VTVSDVGEFRPTRRGHRLKFPPHLFARPAESMSDDLDAVPLARHPLGPHKFIERPKLIRTSSHHSSKKLVFHVPALLSPLTDNTCGVSARHSGAARSGEPGIQLFPLMWILLAVAQASILRSLLPRLWLIALKKKI
jgi:hypothetical protein